MTKLKRRLLCLGLCILLIGSIFCPVLAEGEDAKPEAIDTEQAQQLIDAVVDHLILYGRYEEITEKSLYLAGIEKLLQENPELYTTVLKGMLESIDQYSEYYTASESEDLMISVSGEVTGIGVTIDFSAPETARIASVIPDTPECRCGKTGTGSQQGLR